jgi:hypothetical protein
MKKIITIFLLVLFLSAGFYWYAYKGHRDIAAEKPDYSLTLSSFQKDFEDNDSLFNIRYADKTIEIFGIVTAIDSKNQSIMLDEKIAISLNQAVPDGLKISDAAYIKGRYVGFDDLLEEFKIDQAVVLEK